MQLTISIAQMDIALGQPAVNLEKVTRFAREAARRGSDWLILPELWSTAYTLENAADFATPLDEGIFAEVGRIAAENHIHIIGSCLSVLNEKQNEEQNDKQYGNTMTWHSPDGECIGSYSKLHLFRLMDEHLYLAAGQTPTMIKTEWGDVGLTICYDLRFPELFRRYALDGARLVIVPAEWPHPRLDHWRTLLRARAIENQMYIVACNRVGAKGETHFSGHSAIINPWGETIVEAGETEIMITATIDPDDVATFRQEIPVFNDRRVDSY